MNVVWLFLPVGCSSSSSGVTGRYEIRTAVVAPTIDGQVETAEWSEAQEAAPVLVVSDAGGEKTSIRILHDRDSLFIAVHCVDSRIAERAEDIWKNDSVRFSIMVGNVGADSTCNFGFSMIPQGLVSARFSRFRKGFSPPMREIKDFSQPLDPGLYEAKCAVGEGGWSTELKISWEAIRPLKAPPDEFAFIVERRNINGEKIDVADWPYDKEIIFTFAEKKAAPPPSAAASETDITPERKTGKP